MCNQDDQGHSGELLLWYLLNADFYLMAWEGIACVFVTCFILFISGHDVANVLCGFLTCNESCVCVFLQAVLALTFVAPTAL